MGYLPIIKKESKKGAIELSMTTIIIVVIGITLLTLGLRWIYGVFGGLTEQTQELERLTQDQIITILDGSGEVINVATSVIDNIERGDTYNLQVIMRNELPEYHGFIYDVVVEDTPGNFDPQTVTQQLRWYTQTIDLDSGEGFKDFISIDTKNFPIGQYRARVTLTCTDCTPTYQKTQPIIFEVIL
jgi:hypothetical protein